MGSVRVKPGVAFTTIAPAGFRLLRAIDATADRLDLVLTITSACDGTHSGPTDPHLTGEAYDVRTHDLTTDQLREVVTSLHGMLGSAFYILLEAVGTPNAHLHLQRRRGTTWPPVEGLTV